MENLPPGFRFHPTDEELLTYYLSNKVSDFRFISRVIADVDLNKCEPWDLPGKAAMGEKQWYFFSLRDRKYPTGLRTNRATNAGYWKTTGKDKEINQSGVLVGLKKTLVFYKGRAPKGEKSNWVMHEYRLENKFPYKPTKDEWVVCRVFKKNAMVKKPQETSSFESPCDDMDTTTVNELGEIEMSRFSGHQQENNVDTNMNWAAIRDAANQSLLNWPSGLLGSNASMNSMLLAAIQLRGYQPTSADLNMLLAHGNYCLGTDLNAEFASSSSTVVDSADHQVQYNLDSIWKNC